MKELGQSHFFFFFFFFFCEFAPTDGKWYSAITWARSCLYQCVYNFIKILRMKQEFGPGSFFRILISAKPRPIKIDIPQYLGLEHVNIYAYAFFVSRYSTPFER